MEIEMPDITLIKKCTKCGDEFDSRSIGEEEYRDLLIYSPEIMEDTMSDTIQVTMNSVCYDCQEDNDD